MELLMEHLAKGFMTMLIISMPCVLIAAAVGLVVGILQAVTQVQEQTIAAAPKIFAVFLLIIIAGTFYVRLLSEYFYESADLAFNIIPKEDNFVLAPEESLAVKRQGSNIRKPGVGEVMRHPGKIPYADRKQRQIRSMPVAPTTPEANFAEKKYINTR